MSLNATPAADRLHIGIFGRRNAGKSSIINGITGQNLAIVSDVKGTTTDPVYKAMELLPLGPVMLIDTPGLDDEGELGALRVQKSYQVLNKTDVGVLVVDAAEGLQPEDRAIAGKMREKNIPFVLVYNKSDTVSGPRPAEDGAGTPILYASTRTGEGIEELKEKIAACYQAPAETRRIVGDLLAPGDFVVLVVPIDESAPKGRLILPQQQTIRDILEANATAIVVKDTELADTLANLGKKPKLVITDSQVFAKAAADTPADILLTSFSILFARYKGNLAQAVRGAKALDALQDGDRILISEGCTHHRQCNDIGTVKLPGWIAKYTGKKVDLHFTAGTEFPEDLSPYKLIVHCGGCTLNEREMQYRLKCAAEQNVPVTNYGISIAYMQGILKRSVAPFPEIFTILK